MEIAGTRGNFCLIRRTGASQKTGKPYDFFSCAGFKAGCKASFNPKDD
ncbi:MAG: hypothetical protein FWF31_10060 [Desulfobulbus sp.]|nr:hypothetical protein [Desulfobulbus sp.]